DHRRMMLRKNVEVLGQQTSGMYAGKYVVERPLARRDLQGQKVPPGHRIRMRRICHAFAQVEQKAAIFLLESGEKGLGVLRFQVGYARLGLQQIGFVGLLHIAHKPAIKTLDARVTGEADALACGHTAEKEFAFDVTHQCRKQRRLAVSVPILADHGHRPTDHWSIVFMVRPLAAMFKLLRNWSPEGQGVIAEMIVQVDQAGKDRTSGLNDCNVCKPGWRRLSAILDRNDVALVDVDNTVWEHRKRVTHDDDPPGHRLLWPCERINRTLLFCSCCHGGSLASGASWRKREPCASGAHTMTPLGTLMVILRRFASSFVPVRFAHPSCSCIHEGNPAGKSISGIGKRSPSAQVSP